MPQNGKPQATPFWPIAFGLLQKANGKASRKAGWIHVNRGTRSQNRYARLVIAGDITLLYLGRVDGHPAGLLDASLKAANEAVPKELIPLRDANKSARW